MTVSLAFILGAVAGLVAGVGIVGAVVVIAVKQHLDD